MVLLLNGLGKWTLLTLWLQKSIYKIMVSFIFLHMNISETNVFILLEISRLKSCIPSLPHPLHSHELYTPFKLKIILYVLVFPFILSLPFLSLMLSPRLFFSSNFDIAWCRVGIHKEMVTRLCQIEESISINSNHVIRLQADYHVKSTNCTILQSETLSSIACEKCHTHPCKVVTD